MNSNFNGRVLAVSVNQAAGAYSLGVQTGEFESVTKNNVGDVTLALVPAAGVDPADGIYLITGHGVNHTACMGTLADTSIQVNLRQANNNNPHDLAFDLVVFVPARQ